MLEGEKFLFLPLFFFYSVKPDTCAKLSMQNKLS
jgi:hypothetical protein